MSTFEATDPDTIRTALAAKLAAIIPTLTWQQACRWTWTKDREVSGTLRNFDLRFKAETEVIVNPETGQQGAYGGGIEYRTEVELVVSYPVNEHKIETFMGADARDLGAILVAFHETTNGVFPQSFSADRRVVSSHTGSSDAYIGTFSFAIHFFASDQVAVAS